jgi:hypothetical protein
MRLRKQRAAKTALEYYRELAAEADMSERGNQEDCAAHEMRVFEDWRPLREKATE